MAANPAVSLGIASGLAAGAYIYVKEKNPKRAALAAVTVFLAMGAYFHFIIVPVFAGYHANKLVHRYI